MRFTRFGFENFRNLHVGSLEPDPGFNLIFGANAQGKTNLLEALHWFGPMRSFRAAHAARDVIRRSAAFARLSAHVEAAGRDTEALLAWDGDERRLKVDGKAVERTEWLGRFAVVVYQPDDIDLVRGPKDERRRYVDDAVAQARPNHARRVAAFGHAARQRNELLRRRPAADDPMLAAFTAEWARLGAAVVLQRASFARALAPRLGEIIAAVSGDHDLPTARYRCPGLDTIPLPAPGAGVDEARTAEAEMAAALSEAAYAGHARSLELGYTAVGPTQDDVELMLLDRPYRVTASQGQARTAALALKIAELELLRERIGEWPVLLLDDLSSELDEHRRARLAARLAARGEGQVFVTSTEPRLPGALDAAPVRSFRAEGGVIRPA